MKLDSLTDDDLREWRENSVTSLMRDVLTEAFGAQKRAALQSYWEGNPWPSEDIASLRRMGDMLEDFFEASSDDVRVTMEQFNEYKRYQAD